MPRIHDYGMHSDAGNVCVQNVVDRVKVLIVADFQKVADMFPEFLDANVYEEVTAELFCAFDLIVPSG